MKLILDNFTNKIIQGDCLEVMGSIPDNSVDAVVTDPPYELGFMGKSWDRTGIAYSVEMWSECLRVLKPGGHLLSFGGTRTYHRMAVAIEDAGFEIRDMIEWVYGSGFPKSLNIGKAVDKLQGNEREVVGKRDWNDPMNKPYTNKHYGGERCRDDIPMKITKGTSEWEGWGTALKPAHEPICMARKPLAEKTVAENVLKWGTGGINIDGSRVGIDLEKEPDTGDSYYLKRGKEYPNKGSAKIMGQKSERVDITMKQGRFPANLIHDNSEEVRECFPDTTTNGVKTPFVGGASKKINLGGGNVKPYETNSGNASRFFKSIKQDLHCSLCYDTIDPYQLTKNICNNTNVNNVEKSLETTQATTESTALKNATGKVNKNLVQNVKSAGNLCDLCGTSIAQRLVAIMQDQSQGSTLGELSMPEHKKQILEKCLVSFVELRGNTDTIPTMENLNLLFGYVLNAIEEYTQKCEDTKSEDKNQWKSLIYKSKASKSERNKGCEELEEKIQNSDGQIRTYNDRCLTCKKKFVGPPEKICHCPKGLKITDKSIYTNKNNHPTVKPIALMEYLINMVTPKGGIVLDPFIGSGTTAIAARKLFCKYIGIELNPEYIKIAKARLAQEVLF